MDDPGSVRNRLVAGIPPAATKEGKSSNVLVSFAESRHETLRFAALQVDIHHISVLEILRRNKFHPFKLKLVQKLNEDAPYRRTEFCGTMIEMLTESPQFLGNFIFPNEATLI